MGEWNVGVMKQYLSAREKASVLAGRGQYLFPSDVTRRGLGGVKNE